MTAIPRKANTSRVVDTAKARSIDLAKIHLAKKQLGWDDDTYRDILQTVCQVRSAGELDFAGRRRFLQHLERCGFKPKDGKTGKPLPRLTPQQAKVFSLWQQLHAAGRVQDRRFGAMEAWVRAQTGVDRLAWLTGPQLDQVIESAKLWLARGR
ncbi:MAG: regulatory protein GemA [Burkholderiales bacterium]|nr:regulatory protein GemA [Burkholderiales bacterium]